MTQTDAGEFTKDLEACYRSIFRHGAYKGYSVHSDIAPLIREALDRLDAQAKEIERLNELVFAYESVNAPVNPLLTTNKTQADRIETLDLTILEVCDQLKAENEEIEKLKTDNVDQTEQYQFALNEIIRVTTENAKLKGQLANRECVTGGQGYCGYSQETMNALVAERDALKAENKAHAERIEKLEKEKTNFLDIMKRACQQHQAEIDQALNPKKGEKP